MRSAQRLLCGASQRGRLAVAGPEYDKSGRKTPFTGGLCGPLAGYGNAAHEAQLTTDKEIEMRALTANEIQLVAGGTGQCTAEDSANNYGGVTDTSSLGDDLVDIYEGLVQAASHIIERVANAL